MAEISEELREKRRAAGKKGAAALAAKGTRRNQWEKRRDAHDVEHLRRQIKVGMVLSRLERALAGEVEMTPVQVTAAKVLLDKAMPSLSAVEQTTIDPSSALGDADIRDQLRALLSAHPDIVAELLGEQARQARQSADSAPDHASHPVPAPISRAA